MMTTLNITVFNNKVLIDNPVIIPEGNLNTVFAVFNLPDEWNGLTAKVKFGDIAPITIPSSKTVAIPLFAIKGDVSVKVFAYSLVNDEYSLIHSPAPSQITICEGSFDTDGETPTPPTPTHEYLDKTTLWGGYSAYFGSLTDAPADAVAEFESVNISTMTLEEVVTEIEVINKIILDDHSGGVTDVQVNGTSVVTDGVAEVTIPVTDVQVNASSVVENGVADIDLSDYVTTNTAQTITATKSFFAKSLNEEVFLDVNATEIDYYRSSGTDFNSFELVFPNSTRGSSDIVLYIADEAGDCEYVLPMLRDYNSHQIATTDDISLVVTYTPDNNTWSTETPYTDILAAINAGINVRAKAEFIQGNLRFYAELTLVGHLYNAAIGFRTSMYDMSTGNTTVITIAHTIANTVTFETHLEYGENAELKSNKVTTIDTSSPSATEYPSESAVVSYVSGIVGNINTILDTINGEVI